MKKYKKITSRGKRFLRHYDRRSTNEKYKKFSRCNIIKKRYISKLPPKNPFTVPKHNIDIRGNFAKYLNMFGKKKALERLCTTNLSKYKKNKRRGLGMMVYKKLIDGLSAERNAILELYSDSLCYSTNKGTHAIQGNIKGTLVRWIIGEKK
ncbi:TPA: hypothetical protein SBX19_001004 [Campylobacter coli]|nr:hypothetical protein [Campylobacter coli]HDU9443902.1 hypothetical protein [Campylobacter coli]HDU9451418.1 hypothetical protein [Campylobacter coli]HDU9455253.1 hypothetical protein [Campylobacter coli]HDU9459057.1 hypothetical protein [Campylobacter coli]